MEFGDAFRGDPRAGDGGTPQCWGSVPGCPPCRGALRAEHPPWPLCTGGLPQRGHLRQPAGGGVPLRVPPRALREAFLRHEHPQLPPTILHHLPGPPAALPLHSYPDVSPGGGMGWGCGVGEVGKWGSGSPVGFSRAGGALLVGGSGGWGRGLAGRMGPGLGSALWMWVGTMGPEVVGGTGC